jgi:hypothetical protein
VQIDVAPLKGKKYTAELIVTKLREAEVLLAKGMATAEVCRQLEVTSLPMTEESNPTLTWALQPG